MRSQSIIILLSYHSCSLFLILLAHLQKIALCQSQFLVLVPKQNGGLRRRTLEKRQYVYLLIVSFK